MTPNGNSSSSANTPTSIATMEERLMVCKGSRMQISYFLHFFMLKSEFSMFSDVLFFGILIMR